MMTMWIILMLSNAVAATDWPCAGFLATTGVEDRVIEVAATAYPDLDRHPEATVRIYNHVGDADGGRVFAVVIEHLDPAGRFFELEQRIHLVRVDADGTTEVVAAQKVEPPPDVGGTDEVVQFAPVYSPAHGCGVVAQPRALPGCAAFGVRLVSYDHGRSVSTSEGLVKAGTTVFEGLPKLKVRGRPPARGLLRGRTPRVD